MELNNGQVKVINLIIDYLNANMPKKPKKIKIMFDELSTTRDSICISTVGDGSPKEVNADVTGMFLSGSIPLRLTYRIMSSANGNNDLEYIGVVDYMYRFLEANSREIGADGIYIEKVSQLSGAKLDAVYSGGVKDFSGSFEINYERRRE